MFATELEDEFCVLGQHMREIEFALFARYLHPDYDDANFEEECIHIALTTGNSEKWASRGIFSYTALRHLPQLRELQFETKRLDVNRLSVISDTVMILDHAGLTDALAELDKYLVGVFTANVPGTELLTPQALRRRLTNRLRRIDAALAPKRSEVAARKKFRDHPGCDVDFYPAGVGEAGMNIVTDAATMHTIESRLHAVAEEHKLSFADAVQKVLLGTLKSDIKPVLHVFTPKNDRSSYYLPGSGWSGAGGAAVINALLEDNPSRIVDLDAAAVASTDAYVPTTAMRAFIQARDGTCIYPNCNKDANRCQLDHRIPFNQGGKTTPANLFSLCQTHHNRKTDKQAFYIPDPDTGSIVWLFADGTYAVVEPEGILDTFTTPDNPRWSSTIKQRWDRRAKHAEFHARCHKLVETYEEGKAPFWDTVKQLEKLEEEFELVFRYYPDEPYELLPGEVADPDVLKALRVPAWPDE